MFSFLFNNPPVIKSHEILDKDHLRCFVENKNSPCGAIDFIADKVNFNISCKRIFFKGMDNIKNIILNYENEKLVFTLSNKKTLSFKCNPKEFEAISTHFKNYKNADINQKKKDSFFNS